MCILELIYIFVYLKRTNLSPDTLAPLNAPNAPQYPPPFLAPCNIRYTMKITHNQTQKCFNYYVYIILIFLSPIS